MLTTKPDKESIAQVFENARGMVLDHLACGIDPSKVTFYLQSAVQEVFELNLIFGMLVSVNRLSRLPSLKDMARAAHITEMPFGLLGYPVMQAADILLPKAHVVPVGKDNAAHVEITREIAGRFNRMYGEVFPEPDLLLGEVPTLVGTDGKQKMSKSLDNAIFLSDDAQAVEKKVRSMYTDPKRVHAHIPGTVEGNPVFIYHDAFNDEKSEVADLKERYEKGAVGDAEVKAKLANAINRFLAPMRDRYARLRGGEGSRGADPRRGHGADPTGNTLLAHWLRKLVSACRASEIKPGIGYRVKRSDYGTFLELGNFGGPRGGSKWYPFKVYVSGANPSSSDTDWRTFRVRAGAIFFDTATAVNVTGTDGSDDDPDNETAATGTDRFTVPDETADYYVWVEFEYSGAAWSASIVSDADPTTNGWSDFPDFDGHHLLIAHIDTDTNSADKTAVIRQYVRQDIVFGPLTSICAADGKSKDAAVPMVYKEEIPS